MPSNKPTDPYILSDLLYCQKLLTDSYNRLGNISTTEAISTEIISLLIEEHQIKTELLAEITKRKLITIRPADPNVLNNLKISASHDLQG